MSRIPLAEFQLHVLRTHLKDRADAVRSILETQALKTCTTFESNLSQYLGTYDPNDGHPEWQEDAWYRTEVPLDACYLAHSVFRSYPVPSGDRFVDFLVGHQIRQKIETACFPCWSEIQRAWSGQAPIPEPLVAERDGTDGRYFVLDGQFRVIWHWYHNRQTIRVFTYRGNLKV